MFSGIVEAVEPILQSQTLENAFRISVSKPHHFDDIKPGDSIACDGVCLTLEKFTATEMIFVLAAETVKVLNWKPDSWKGKKLNLERSLRFGDRIHGHLVTGHVDSLGQVTQAEALGESWLISVKVAGSILPYVWKKGSITLNGTSLTVNELIGSELSVCLIPETIQRTNLASLKVGDSINVEPDYFAKAVQRAIEFSKTESRGSHE